ncbi:MAG: glycosyltransferase, partial [Acidimicrobiia bacterium]|nr:glycosyltransferase [Acidimicrobiia bacterium]
GDLGDAERAVYEKVSHANAEELGALVRPGDIVLLHDPQTAGLVPAMKAARAITVWRSHIGSDVTNDLVDRSWAFVRRYLEEADAYVFSRAAYVPAWADDDVYLIAPSVDPFSAKNAEMPQPTVRAVLAHIGLIQGNGEHRTAFTRRDGSPGRVDHCADIIRAGPAPKAEVPLVVQVSRWDRLKDMPGVMAGFVEHACAGTDAHLALVGPNVTGVTDDPEGAEVLDECLEAWRALPHAARTRVQLVCLPMSDVEENAAMVNAIQRHAAVVVQKSLAEGFGLTVAEAMWKARPIVASAVGGIQDQVVDGEHGLLLADPADLAGFGVAVRRLVCEPDFAAGLGERARQRAIEQFLGNRHLLQYVELFADLVRR